MKLGTLRFSATLSLLALSACYGGNTAVEPAGLPPTDAGIGLPLTSMTVITAVYKGNPVPRITITLWKAELPKCPSCEPKFLKKLASGKTGAKGRVSLSGNWTNDTFLCADGSYTRGSATYNSTLCRRPFPKSATLQFQ
jgi:hypothetical protein